MYYTYLCVCIYAVADLLRYGLKALNNLSFIIDIVSFIKWRAFFLQKVIQFSCLLE